MALAAVVFVQLLQTVNKYPISTLLPMVAFNPAMNIPGPSGKAITVTGAE